MRVHALFFASYRDLVGEERLPVTLPEDATVSTLVAAVRERGEPWIRLPVEPAVAVNRRYADGGTVLRPGDEVAFIPPVAGG